MGQVPTSAPTSIKINNKDLRDFGIEMTSYPSELLLPQTRSNIDKIIDRPGGIVTSRSYSNWSFTFNCYITGSSHQNVIKQFDDFKQWIDIEQNNLKTWNVGGQRTLKSLKIELCGHKYYYTDGTVAVTNGNASITGTNTFWLSYVKPGVEFIVNGDSTTYYIQSVQNNTSILLTATISRSTDSGLSYKIERRRYLFANLNGQSGITSDIRGHFKGDTYQFSIGFKTAYPFWVGDKFILNNTSLSANSYTRLRGLGNAPHLIGLSLKDVATTPQVGIGDYEYHSRYYGSTGYRDVLNFDYLPATTTPTVSSP